MTKPKDKMRSRLGQILEHRRDRLALAAIGATAVVASIAEASVLVTITLLGLRLAGAQDDAVDLPFDIPLDELSNTRLIVAGFVLLVLRLAILGFNAWIGARLSESVLFRWRRRVVHAFLGASWERQQGEDEGHLQTVTQSYVSAVSSVVQQLANALTAGTSFLTFVFGAFLLHPLAAMGLATFGAVLFVAVRPLTTFVRQMAGRQKAAAQEYARLLGEIVSMPQEARVFGIEPQLMGRLEVRLREFVVARRRQAIAQKMTPQTFQTLGLGIVLTGLALATQLEFSDAAVIGALVLLLVRSLNYGQTFQSTYQSVVSSQPSIDGLLDAVADYESTRGVRGSEAISGFSDIWFENVTLGYEQEEVLRDVDLKIRMGESIGVIGSSGSGKSTLAASLLALLEARHGRILVDGRDLLSIDEGSWSDVVCFVPQEPKLFDGTVGENIAFFRSRLSDSEVRDAAEAAHLGQELQKWGGLDHPVGPRGSRLSGGQRQRVCIARALAGSPALLVLDEPTSALDGDSEDSIVKVLEDLRSRCTMVVIAHRLSTLEFCDRILLVEGGRVREIGSGSDIQEKASVRRLAESALSAEPTE